MTGANRTRQIPALIRRNTLFLALSQAFTGAGMGMVYSIGPLMIAAVSGSVALSGLSVTLMGLSRFLVAYPIGRLTDQYGRKPAMLAGLACGLFGALLVGFATVASIFPLLIGALLVFGMGMNAAQQLRVAAADMYPPDRRAEGLGYVLTGSLVGVLVGPILVTASQNLSPILGLEPLGTPWLFLPVLIIPGMLFVLQVRPDPREIAANLASYYPGYNLPRQASGSAHVAVTLRTFLAVHPRRVAVAMNVASQGNMAVVMVSSALLLHQHGYTLSEIAVSSAMHSFGMWAFAMPMGRLADVIGRRYVLLVGGIIATAGAMLATMGSDYWAITMGAILVGLGWCGCNVAATVVIADTTQPLERGRAIGMNDSLTASANILIPVIAGPMAALLGVWSTGILAAALTVPPVLLLIFTLREPSPGVYELSHPEAPSLLPDVSAGGVSAELIHSRNR